MDGLGQRVAHPRDRADGVGAHAQVRHFAQVLEGVALGRDRIGSRDRRPSRRPRPSRPAARPTGPCPAIPPACPWHGRRNRPSGAGPRPRSWAVRSGPPPGAARRRSRRGPARTTGRPWNRGACAPSPAPSPLSRRAPSRPARRRSEPLCHRYLLRLRGYREPDHLGPRGSSRTGHRAVTEPSSPRHGASPSCLPAAASRDRTAGEEKVPCARP